MTEKQIQLLGFTKEFEHGEDPEYYYYVYNIADGLSFISNASDEVKDGQWYVDVFNTDPIIRFCQMEKVQVLINTFESAIIKTK